MMRRAILMLALSISFASSYSLPAIDHKLENEDELSSLRRLSHVLGRYDPRAPMTCDKLPRVCRAKGSPGHDCCRKQCVNVMTDNLNCGECGKKCKYGEACCGGKCVNVMYDRKNCGRCKNKCKKGSFCQFGMCSYA